MEIADRKASPGLTNSLSEPADEELVGKVHAELQRVLADPVFRYSQRSSNLLRFIVDRTLRGKIEDLKERIVGIEVFRRAPDYDTSNDSIVRVVANEVRKRLAEYYAKPDNGQQVRIEIPIRSYVAEFRLPRPAPLPEPTPPTPPGMVAAMAAPSAGKASAWPNWRLALWSVLATVALVTIVWAGWRVVVPRPSLVRFWSPIVSSSGPVMICIGSPFNPADDGIPTQPPSTNAGAQQNVPFYNSEQRVYVRMLDANAAEQMAAFLRRQRKDSIVRPTEGSQLADLRNFPIILYGMFLNEWAEKAGSDLHFRLQKESESGHGLRWIEDASNPADKKWSVNLAAPSDEITTDYALISRIRDQATGRWWMGIAGLTGVGTFAANQIALDPKAMAMAISALPKDWDQKNVQIVLEIKVVQGSPGDTKVIASYSW